jgi:hypothetical protein
MSEEHNDGSWSGLAKTAIGTIGTIVTAGGAWLVSHLGGGEKEAEVAQPAAVTAPAPVINITTNNTQQQKQVAGGGGKTVIIKEKEAAPKKKTEKEALKEEPQW